MENGKFTCSFHNLKIHSDIVIITILRGIIIVHRTTMYDERLQIMVQSIVLSSIVMYREREIDDALYQLPVGRRSSHFSSLQFSLSALEFNLKMCYSAGYTISCQMITSVMRIRRISKSVFETHNAQRAGDDSVVLQHRTLTERDSFKQSLPPSHGHCDTLLLIDRVDLPIINSINFYYYKFIIYPFSLSTN